MKKFIFLGFISLIIALLVKAPASLISQQINQRSPLLLQGTEGTLWKGRIAQASYKTVAIGAIEWSLDPLTLLSANIGGHFKIIGSKVKAKGLFNFSINQKVTLKNIRFSAESTFINQLQPYQLTGTFLGDIDYVIMQLNDTMKLPIIDGQVNWSKGGLTKPIEIPSGNYQAIIQPTTNNKLLVTLESHEAALIIEGDIKLDEQWEYDTDLKLTPGERGNKLNNLLKLVSQPDAQGSYIIRRKGRFF